MRRSTVLIGGSTASGKSALAVSLARELDGVVVNADSQQLFADLPLLTARPSADELVQVPHALFGVLGPHEQPSVALWLRRVDSALEGMNSEQPAIICGGTGLYLEALIRGLSTMPDIPDRVRRALRGCVEPSPDLHARLARLAPEMAATRDPNDRQRILRALEVIEASGRSPLDWQRKREPPLLEAPPLLAVALVPPREVVARRIESRLSGMLEAGALTEVADLATRLESRGIELTQLPIAKVHGARELLAVVEGRMAIEEARGHIGARTRQYAKRQRTFFRHRLKAFEPIAGLGDDPDVQQQLHRRLAVAGVDAAAAHR